MTRPLIPLALLALAVLPDWATAFGRRGASCPPPAATYCPPPVVFVPPCLPPFEVAPQQQPAPARPGPTVTQEPGPSEPPKPEPTPAEPPKVTPAPPPRPVAPGIPSGTGRSDASPPKPAAPVEPAGLTAPKPTQPTQPSPFTEIPPKKEAPKVEVPKVAPPAPKESEGAKIPPLAPPLPGGDAGLPPLSIPPTPGGTSTSKSSPLTGAGREVEVIPVDGPPPASPSAKRKVGFFNHTDRPVTLVVEGQTLTLPGRHHVSAEVPAAFAWTLDGGPERKTEVPTTAPGVEVVIRK